MFNLPLFASDADVLRIRVINSFSIDALITRCTRNILSLLSVWIQAVVLFKEGKKEQDGNWDLLKERNLFYFAFYDNKRNSLSLSLSLCKDVPKNENSREFNSKRFTFAFITFITFIYCVIHYNVNTLYTFFVSSLSLLCILILFYKWPFTILAISIAWNKSNKTSIGFLLLPTAANLRLARRTECAFSLIRRAKCAYSYTQRKMYTVFK